jgi:hypothetical protein
MECLVKADMIRPVGNGVICDATLCAPFERMAPLHNRSYRTLRDGPALWRFPGTSCQATFISSLRDKRPGVHMLTRMGTSGTLERASLARPILDDAGEKRWHCSFSIPDVLAPKPQSRLPRTRVVPTESASQARQRSNGTALKVEFAPLIPCFPRQSKITRWTWADTRYSCIW